jgi:hypothetical protein
MHGSRTLNKRWSESDAIGSTPKIFESFIQVIDEKSLGEVRVTK